MIDSEKLKGLIDEANRLIEEASVVDEAEYQVWYNSTYHYILKRFDENSHEYKMFCKYSLPEQEIYINDDYIFKSEKHLIIIKGMLEDFLSDILIDEKNELTNYNPHTDDIFERIFSRFKKVAFQLSHRYENRETLRINDEYDVQDLLRSILSLYYDDVRTEEWTPSYAGSSLRIDFLIPEIEAVIEIKKTRRSMTDKTLSEELIIDIEKYQTHPKCKKIYCFVYDPDTILRNPAAIKKDIEKKHKGLVNVFIEA